MTEIQAFKDTEFVAGGQVWVAQRDSRGEVYKTFPTGRVAETNVFVSQKTEGARDVLPNFERTFEE